MNELLTKKCVPCEGGAAPLSLKEAKKLLTKVRGWRLVKGKALRQELVMADFPAAIEFVHDVAQEAESEGHHPDLHLTGYRNLAIDLSTHAIGGLSLNDFILAAKIDALPRKLKAMKGTK
ncbi:MAG: 4a-hydroxytetrahydrobiopterin dehydratase [Elusimicrobia bacterium]|nr:4a-hydroxytetrahydrobiopterin dehydratase [Elusimicrobiota bacterium]